MRRRITIDNSRINALAANPEMVAKFPFLSKAYEKKCCGGRVERKADHQAIKAAIASMDDAAKQAFKEVLKAAQVYVFVTDEHGCAKEVSF